MDCISKIKIFHLIYDWRPIILEEDSELVIFFAKFFIVWVTLIGFRMVRQIQFIEVRQVSMCFKILGLQCDVSSDKCNVIFKFTIV